MERPLTIRPLSIQDENSVIHHIKATIDGKSKSSKPISKNGAKLETRKALNDITNKKSVRVEASAKQTSKKSTVVEDGNLHNHVLGADVSLKKKSSVNEKVNIAEEGFLHDHNKCIDAQKAAVELNFWATVLPGHGSADLMMDQAKNDPDIDNFSCIPDLEELYKSEFSDWSDSWRKTPPTSPVRWNSPPGSPFAWDLELLKLALKEDDFHV